MAVLSSPGLGFLPLAGPRLEGVSQAAQARADLAIPGLRICPLDPHQSRVVRRVEAVGGGTKVCCCEPVFARVLRHGVSRRCWADMRRMAHRRGCPQLRASGFAARQCYAPHCDQRPVRARRERQPARVEPQARAADQLPGRTAIRVTRPKPPNAAASARPASTAAVHAELETQCQAVLDLRRHWKNVTRNSPLPANLSSSRRGAYRSHKRGPPALGSDPM